MAELLLSKEYRVIGTTRDVRKVARSLPLSLRNKVELVGWDMLDQDGIAKILSSYRPAEMYNFASYSSGSGMYDDPIGIGEINGLAVARILEVICGLDKNIRFCQASSREIFGEARESPQSEETLVNPRSPYGAAKLYADSMIRIYRHRYGLFACSAILFNHESPRRGLEFVTRKITHEAAKIKLGQANKIRLGNLEARRDWGHAREYVRAMWMMLQQKEPDDFVIATGEQHSVREFVETAFNYVGLDYRDHVVIDPQLLRPAEVETLLGDATKAKQQLGWQHEVTFKGLVHEMVESDLRHFSGARESQV